MLTECFNEIMLVFKSLFQFDCNREETIVLRFFSPTNARDEIIDRFFGGISKDLPLQMSLETIVRLEIVIHV